MNYLVVDYGTSGCRASLVDDSGRIGSSCRKPTAVECRGEAAEIDLRDAWAVTASVIRELLEKTGYPEIDAAGVSSLLGWVFLDSAGKPLTKSFIWMDTRGSSELETAINPDKSEIYRKTGRRFSNELLIAKWGWLKKHKPEIAGRTAKIISLKDELVRRLTGVTVTDYAHLNYTMLWNIGEHKLDSGMLEIAGVSEDQFPEARYPFQEAGGVTAEAAGITGLKQGLPVITGSIDGTTAMYGGGMASGEAAVLVSGTTDVAMKLVGGDKMHLYEGQDVLTVNTGMVPGTFAVGGSTGTSGGALSKMAELLAGDYHRLVESAESVPPGSEGLLVSPGLSGERAPYWNASLSGALTGLRMEHTPAHIMRAVMEGAAFRLRRLFSYMFDGDTVPDSLYTVGGYARLAVWNRIKADICGLTLILPEELEATTVGTAMFCDCFKKAADKLESVSRQWVNPAEEYSSDENNYNLYTRQFENMNSL